MRECSSAPRGKASAGHSLKSSTLNRCPGFHNRGKDGRYRGPKRPVAEGSKTYGGPGLVLRGRGARVCRRPVSRILSRTVIPLGDALLRRSSNLPGSFGAHLFRWRPAWARRAGTHSRQWVKPRIPSLFGLAPCGVYHAPGFTAGAVRSYRTFSPLPAACGGRRYILCGTGRLPALKPESRTLSGTLPCGVRTFLSRSAFTPRQRPPSSPANSILAATEVVPRLHFVTWAQAASNSL
jgi:hypothetical protein